MNLRPHQVRILERMQTYPKGQIIVPTGGGKTMCMIQDTAHVQQSKCGHTTVVVAPRILLAEQLCSEFLELLSTTYTHVMHVHSCLLYTSPSPRDMRRSRMPSSA